MALKENIIYTNFWGSFLVFEKERKSWKIFLLWYEIAMFVWGTSLPALPGRSWDPSLALPVWQAVARAGCLMHTASPGPGCQDRPDKSISKQSSVSSSYIINMLPQSPSQTTPALFISRKLCYESQLECCHKTWVTRPKFPEVSDWTGTRSGDCLAPTETGGWEDERVRPPLAGPATRGGRGMTSHKTLSARSCNITPCT